MSWSTNAQNGKKLGLLWLHDTGGLLNPLMVKVEYIGKKNVDVGRSFYYHKIISYSCFVECVYIPM